jgi:hypothetical protein
MKIVEAHSLKKRKIIAVTVWPFIFTYSVEKLNEGTNLQHELIHAEQQKEMLLLFFYLWYGIEFLIRKWQGYLDPYRAISFEEEAYRNEHYEDYIKLRPRFAWLKYCRSSG